MAYPIVFSKEDLLKGTQLTAGWYRCIVQSVTEKPGKSDPNSTTLHISMKVNAGEKAGVPFMTYINEKQMDRAAAFLKGFIGRITPGEQYDITSTVGKEVEAYITWNEEFRWNSADEFRQVK